jgi:inner membrane protein
MLPLFALFPTLIAWLFRRGQPFSWGKAWMLSAIGVASHLLLDWTNVYGIRLLAPFSPTWFRGDLNHLFDFWIWAAVLLCIFAPWVSRLVSSEIGAKPSRGRGWALLGLLLFFAIAGVRVWSHSRAIEILSARIYEGGPALRYAAWPNPANPFRWRGYVETPVSHRLYDLNVLGEFDPAAGRIFYKPEDAALIEGVSQNDELTRGLLRFAQFPVWRIAPGEKEDTTRVEVMDVRFGTPPPGRFSVSLLLDSSRRILDSKFRF